MRNVAVAPAPAVAAPAVSRSARRGWSRWHAISAAALVLAGIAATRDAWIDIVRIALHDEESSHVFLVPVVAAWLVWVRRERLRKIRPRGFLAGPLLVAFGWFLYSAGDLALVQAFWHGGAVVVAVGCLVSVLGAEALVRFAPAFLVLAFLVPVPAMVRQEIALPLQNATALVTSEVLDVLGIHAVRSGNVLTIRGVDVAIAEACNGLRMVFALVLVSYAFAFGTPLKAWVRVVVLVLSPVSAIACNVVRLVPTVWIYGAFPSRVGDVFHDVSGWVMLPLAFLILVGILRLLRWALVPVTHYTLSREG